MHTDVALVSATFPVTVRYSFWARFFILMYTAGYDREKQRNLEENLLNLEISPSKKGKLRGEVRHDMVEFIFYYFPLFLLANMYKFSIERSLDHLTQSLNCTISIILF